MPIAITTGFELTALRRRESISKDQQQDDPISGSPSLINCPDFDFDVVSGRGKGFYNRPGNRRLRHIVVQHIAAYQVAKNKIIKGRVLDTIIERVKSQNNGRARFVKPIKSGSWVELSNDEARKKVGHAIREAMISQEFAREKEQTRKVWQQKNAEMLASQQAIFRRLLAESAEQGDTSNAENESDSLSSLEYDDGWCEEDSVTGNNCSLFEPGALFNDDDIV
jgi:hypothetical protein